MTYIQAIILSIIEGLTEFLPVSSTGHLILASFALGIPDSEFLKSFMIIIQMGAILAVVFLYRKILLTSRTAWKTILTAFIPTAVIGFILYKFIKEILLGSEIITVIALFIGGIIIIFIELLHKDKDTGTESIEKISYKQALLVGLFQSISIIPGVSRSAASITGGKLIGMKRETAVIFSFLIAVPTMFAASALDLIDSNFTFSNSELSLLVIGFIGSFVVALTAIKFFLKFVQSYSFIIFGIYRILIAITYWFFIIN